MAQRKANLFTTEAEERQDDGFGGVGALLRRRREEIQQDIEDVSRQLRIRSAYIRAIEDGRFQDLPGSAYAVGFVRAYADYLGLDGNHVVGDYRDELARRSRQNDLVWPSEGTESRFPGGKILLVCLFLTLFIYGGWWYATQSGGAGIKLIDQVPDYIKKATGVGQSVQSAPAPATEPTRTEAQAATTPELPSPAPAPAQPNAAPAAAAKPAEPAPTPAPAVALDANGGSTPAPAPAPAVVATPGANGTAAVPSAVSQASSAPASQPAPAVTAPAAQPTPSPAQSSAPTNPPTAAPPPLPTTAAQLASAAAQPAAPAVVPPPAKIVIRANRDSWIEIRDKDDAVVLQRVLRQGESFNVPDQKGLVMTTGNAGGIVIELEGKPLQSLGSLGVVKRGIKLEPAALSDGSAFNADDQ